MPSNPLTDVIPPRYRKYLYALVFVASIVAAAWQASDGDWQTFVGALVGVLVSATAASNTHERQG